MREQREAYQIERGQRPARPAACFNCETGVLLAGAYGYYCQDCDTYLPSGQADNLASAYFAAIDASDGPRAAELKIRLEYCQQKTIDSLSTD